MREIFYLMSMAARLKIKEIDRDQRRQWRMVINTTVHVISYLFYRIEYFIFYSIKIIIF